MSRAGKGKICNICHVRKPIKEFGQTSKYKPGTKQRIGRVTKDSCKECVPSRERVIDRYCSTCKKKCTKDDLGRGKYTECNKCRLEFKARYIAWAKETATSQICIACNIDKPFSAYRKSTKGGRFGYDHRCIECLEPKKIIDTYKKHKLSEEQYQELLDFNDGRCHSCSKTKEDNGIALCIDHDHRCHPGPNGCSKCVRGLLCDTCNRGAASTEDNIARELNLAAYLIRDAIKRNVTFDMSSFSKANLEIVLDFVKNLDSLV